MAHKIGIIGGSGLDDPELFLHPRDLTMDTPWGEPSSTLREGEIGGVPVVLLARLCLKRAPKIYSYLLWSVVLFRLLCPVSFSSDVSVLEPVPGRSADSGWAVS